MGRHQRVLLVVKPRPNIADVTEGTPTTDETGRMKTRDRSPPKVIEVHLSATHLIDMYAAVASLLLVFSASLSFRSLLRLPLFVSFSFLLPLPGKRPFKLEKVDVLCMLAVSSAGLFTLSLLVGDRDSGGGVGFRGIETGHGLEVPDELGGGFRVLSQ